MIYRLNHELQKIDYRFNENDLLAKKKYFEWTFQISNAGRFFLRIYTSNNRFSVQKIVFSTLRIEFFALCDTRIIDFRSVWHTSNRFSVKVATNNRLIDYWFLKNRFWIFKNRFKIVFFDSRNRFKKSLNRF